MGDIAHVRETSPGPDRPDPGRSRRALRESRFYLGLVALAVATLGINLAFFAIVPIVVPGSVAVGIDSGSMDPAIRTGDVVIGRTWDGTEPLVPGTIVTYEVADGFITHRIVEVRPDESLVTRGDANRAEDPPIRPDQVVATARLIVPYAGLPAAWLRGERYGLVLLFLAMSGAAIYFARFAVDPRHDPWAPPPDRSPRRPSPRRPTRRPAPGPDRRYGPASDARAVNASEEHR